jgi:hypothetical protein
MKQGRFDGMEHEEAIHELDTLMETYQREKLARVAQSKLESDAKKELNEAMARHEKTTYVARDLVPPLVARMKPKDATPDVEVKEYKEEQAEVAVAEDRKKRQEQPVGENTMAAPEKRSPANRPLTTNRDKMAKAKGPKTLRTFPKGQGPKKGKR